MSVHPVTRIRYRARVLVTLVASFGTLALVWTFRPSLPDLPRSLEEPLTVTRLEEFGVLLAWLAFACLALLVLLRALRANVRPWRRKVDGRIASNARSLEAKPWRPARSRPRTPARASDAFADEFVLTLAAPERSICAEQASGAGKLEQAPPISIRVLGPLQITGGKRKMRRLRASAQELIAHLAFHPEGASRDQLLEALWPGEDPKLSEQRLWKSTSDVRRVLGEVIRRERDRYWLDRSRVGVDVDELEGLVSEASGAGGDRRREFLEKALALYRDEPLAGSDFTWSEGEIRRLRGTYVELLEQVGRARLEAGDGRGALDAAERGLTVDFLNEGFWRLAMRAESELGLREAVEARYETLRTILNERIGLDPDRKTRVLYRELLGQH